MKKLVKKIDFYSGESIENTNSNKNINLIEEFPKSRYTFSFKNLLSNLEEDELKERHIKKATHKKNEILQPKDIKNIFENNSSKDSQEINPCAEQTRLKTENFSDDENEYENESQHSNIFNMPDLLSSPSNKNKEKNTNVNISLYEFEKIYDKEEDMEILKKVAKQKLLYFIEQTEKEENYELDEECNNQKNIDKKNYINNKSQNLCKKFVEHPEKFYSETPSELLLRSLN
jgi:hypothetical protein